MSSGARKKSCINSCCCWCAGGAVLRDSRARLIPLSHPLLSITDIENTSSRPRRMKWSSLRVSPSVPLRNSTRIAASSSAACCSGRPWESTACRTPLRWSHAPCVSSSNWVTRPDAHLSAVRLECCSWQR